MRTILLVLAVLITSCGLAKPVNSETEQGSRTCQAVMSLPAVDSLAAFPLGSCLDITFVENMEPYADKLHSALLTWAAVPGTWLCFNPPKRGLPGSRTIHLDATVPDAPNATNAEMLYVRGQLISSKISILHGVTLSPGAYLYLAGQALGFSGSENVDTVLNVTKPNDAVPALTNADRQSIVAVYPDCR